MGASLDAGSVLSAAATSVYGAYVDDLCMCGSATVWDQRAAPLSYIAADIMLMLFLALGISPK